MNKKVFGRKLSRSRPAREALFASLIRGMILHGKIVTTKAKAKAIQGDLDHMITLAKNGSLTSRQKALSYLDNAREIVNTLFTQIGPVFSTRQSGFTRLIRLPRRKGDNAETVRIEWTEKVELKKPVKEKKPKTDSKAKVEKKEVKSKEIKKVAKKAKTK